MGRQGFSVLELLTKEVRFLFVWPPTISTHLKVLFHNHSCGKTVFFYLFNSQKEIHLFLALNEIIIYRITKDERLNLTGFVAECRSRIPVDILNNEYIIP
ncbi:MAG: hypothetical protein CVU51_11390 [Deltaproteobacteria bacterium HGW-Deltaproteobacteria-1]|jgi:hypothetical protein|nr:MAG: hypothetical protein CVU51_11390 [Deltaproteobacteria bacterium HGW-Deltaproteobacteria-1]